MAEGETAEFEVKDEELVDFEGSDYGFGSDEELEIEEIRKQSTDAGLPSTPASSGRFGQDLASADYSPMATDTSAFDAASEGQQASLKEGAESGEIQEEKEEKEDGAVMQPAMARIASGEGASNGGKRVAESRFKKHRKADLEDGELDDAAVVIIFFSSTLFSLFQDLHEGALLFPKQLPKQKLEITRCRLSS